MTQIEKEVETFLIANPAIRQAYSQGLINRRALARKIIKENLALKPNQFEAVIAILRRTKKEGASQSVKIPNDIQISIKDNIAIANLQKTNQALQAVQKMASKISYEKNETFKVVLGTSSIKLFLDEKNLGLVESAIPKNEIIYIRKKIGELSLQFTEKSASQKGIIAFITASLSISDICVEEFLTCSPELLIYVKEENALKAFETIKRMQK
ncbi:MAG: hypothetical protein WC492_01435 [Candidatus Micrarchaeia archaeon]